jgi:hypothetical protein
MLPANPVILRTYAQRLILSPVGFYMTNEAGDATCDLPQRRPPKTTVCPPRFPPIALPLSAPRAHWFRGLLAPINPQQSAHASHLTHTATEHSPQLSSYTPVTSLHTRTTNLRRHDVYGDPRLPRPEARRRQALLQR